MAKNRFPFDEKRFSLTNGITWGIVLLVLTLLSLKGYGLAIVILLSGLLPGYTSSIPGAVIGFIYGVILGIIISNIYIEVYAYLKGKI